MPKTSNGAVLRRVHRWLGLAAAVFVLIISTTGWFLNRTGDLAMGAQYVTWTPILEWYGIQPPRVETGYRLDDADWLVQAAGQLFLNHERIAVADGGLIGAVTLAEPPIIVAAIPDRMYLFTLRGELIEKLDRSNRIPLPIANIGVTASGMLAVDAARGRFEADEHVVSWSPLTGDSVRWARPAPPPAGLRDNIAVEARQHILSWERLVLDLHSGRLLGRTGIILYDLVAIVLIVLAATGLYMWLKAPNRNR